jgi:hypothetical protein
MLRTALFVSALSLAIPVHSFEYAMVKGDTLWSLSERYLKDPYLWPQITYLDGTVVKEPRRMPIGTLLLIPKTIANGRAITELEESKQLPAANDIAEVSQQFDNNQVPNTSSIENVKKTAVSAYVSNPSLLAIIERLDANQRNRLWDYWLKSKDGLVRAYHNGQEVVIEAQLLIDEMRHMESKNQ